MKIKDMKKLLLSLIILLNCSCLIFAEEELEEVGNNSSGEETIVYELYPKDFKAFHTSIDYQLITMNKIFKKSGAYETVRYFLSLKNFNEIKALEALSLSEMSSKTKDPLKQEEIENLRMVILENLPIGELKGLMDKLFEGIGCDKAVRHWGYKNYGIFNLYLYMVPNVRAQQYINFFMNYQTEVTHEKKGLIYGKETVKETKEQLLKDRGLKIAKVLNLMDTNTAIQILYGREDTRFIGHRDRIIPKENSEAPDGLKLTINETSYVYQTEETENNTPIWKDKSKETLNRYTVRSRVFAESIQYIIPHISEELATTIFERESKSNNSNAIIALINSFGCDRSFKILEYLEDDTKDKIFEVCHGDEEAFFDMLGLNDGKKLAQLTDKKSLNENEL